MGRLVSLLYPTVVMHGRGTPYCNLIDPKASDGEVEEMLQLKFERLEVEKVVEG